ncbi:uncharacterized protein N7479_006616 [Penicillium vulpinum]|uniref:Ribosomal RNA methyltransferase FtsJ domain-containing protein n=1 Tax=Penicillium vulpinum TaxID=29845 RepID=A0A1V6S2R6_9EURO|nr:uncharacterized protein N7479_006616 [Penicillium vulpinum]KAJ5959466.1 hypothetical protein N7479_006616 [Penicillium vulpinum]OQE08034.1 hypothetical protein PENVUL_c011G03429 [Penicillium vulpinum]
MSGVMESVFSLHSQTEISPAVVDATSPPDEWTRNFANKIIVPYLKEHSNEFMELSLLRQKGWENPKGDKYFRVQRRNADQNNEKNNVYFHNLMKDIAEELHQIGNAFAIRRTQKGPPKILDMCMAPGGFLEIAMRKNPGSQAVAFSLPVACGGHKSRLPRTRNVDQRFLDITMLASDMGAHEIPTDHPDAKNFLPQQFRPNQLFDLVICDGQVLRTHSRASYRETVEARRLTVTQLALGLEHLNPGGTIIVLLHKLEAWETAKLVWTFAKFSSVKLVKPERGHAKRSSFYMIASQVQSQHTEALQSVIKWKDIWQAATLGSEDDLHQLIWNEGPSAEDFIANFGDDLVRLGKYVWKVQADALAKAPFIKSQDK